MRRCVLWSSPSAHTSPLPSTLATGGRKAGDLTVGGERQLWLLFLWENCNIMCLGGSGAYGMYESENGWSIVMNESGARMP